MIGSGPAGLAAAQQLTRAGHAVTVFERADAPGGLLRYGIPEFKMEKRHLDRRLVQMLAEGTVFRCGVNAGRRRRPPPQLRADYDAIVLAGGATVARGLPVPGADLAGIHQAMEYLPLANRAVAASAGGMGPGPVREPPITARGKHVVIIGGGDTGADCLGTAHRQGAASVTQLEIMPRPPEAAAGQPAVAHLPDDLPGVQRARGGRRAGLRRVHPGVRRPTRPGRVRALRLVEVELSERRLRAGARHRAGAAL